MLIHNAAQAVKVDHLYYFHFFPTAFSFFCTQEICLILIYFIQTKYRTYLILTLFSLSSDVLRTWDYVIGKLPISNFLKVFLIYIRYTFLIYSMTTKNSIRPRLPPCVTLSICICWKSFLLCSYLAVLTFLWKVLLVFPHFIIIDLVKSLWVLNKWRLPFSFLSTISSNISEYILYCLFWNQFDFLRTFRLVVAYQKILFVCEHHYYPFRMVLGNFLSLSKIIELQFRKFLLKLSYTFFNSAGMPSTPAVLSFFVISNWYLLFSVPDTPSFVPWYILRK